MSTVRRVYVYLVAFVSLLVAAYGATGLARNVIGAALPASVAAPDSVRQDVAWNGAYLIVGLPIWLLHWLLAQRAARTSPDERAATLRRLYVYGVLAAMLLAVAGAAQNALELPLMALLRDQPEWRQDPVRGVLQQLPWLVVGSAVWLYHYRVAVSDRLAAGERAGAATVRRWYVYGAALIAFLFLLREAAHVLRLAWEIVAGSATGSIARAPALGLAGAIATALVALGIWVTHWTLRAAGPPHDAIRDDDARSTLRPVYLFLALTVCVGASLAGLAQLLYYALGRLLGVSNPGGVGGNLLVAMAGPVSAVIVYGGAWLSVRHAVSRQALAQTELPRQAGVRRLYLYLVALVAIAVTASGTGGLLWTVADLATSAPRAVSSDTWWREQFSLYATLLAVGLPVWARHWGPVAARDGEAGSLARRIYLYVTLGAAVLALLGAGITVARQVLLLVLGEAATASAMTNLARSLAVSAVAGIVIAYHRRILRRDMAALATTPRPEPAHATKMRAPLPPHSSRPYGVLYQLDGTLHAEWFATPEEARARAAGAQARAGASWASTIHLGDADPSLRSG
jgi:hypothetical protein